MGRGEELAALEPDLPADPLRGPAAAAGADPAEGPASGSKDEARLGLYVHVPFCARRCGYCDFATGAISSAAVERYLAALEREAARRAPLAAGRVFTSVFLGGGTPSALSGRHFARLWRAVTSSFDIAAGAEKTLEANPETVRPALLDAWAEAGIDRLSFGVQSFDPGELAALERIHDAERPALALELARRHGFRRLSIDLMFAFPGHGPRTWERTLASAITLAPEHVSAYCYIPEDATPMGSAVHSGQAGLPPEGVQAELYGMLTGRLAAAGYGCYETSNFALPGAECRHNLVYWLRREWLALGPSAHGLWQGARYANHRDLAAWADALERGLPSDAREEETAVSRADEVVMLGLRLSTGLAPRDHPAALWSEVLARYGAAFERAVETGRLESRAGGVRIAPRHRFVADEIVAWLMAEADRGRRAA